VRWPHESSSFRLAHPSEQVKAVSWRMPETLLFDVLRRSAEPATVDLIVDFISRDGKRR
jgi:hypothetical protein